MTDRTYGLPRRTNAEIIASHEAAAAYWEQQARDNPDARYCLNGRADCDLGPGFAADYAQHLRVMIELLRQDELEKFVDK